MCKGYVSSDFMVACETGEEMCPNGGWVHPKCTEDLQFMTQEDIDRIEIWYCPDCRETRERDMSDNSRDMKENRNDNQGKLQANLLETRED
jgi:hypothetical protein